MVQTLEHPKTVPIPRRRFTREEYYRMAELGLFRGERVELIEGDIIKMSPVSAEHVTCVHRLFQWLFQVFSDATVRIQSPLNLGDSEPEPDIAVVPGKAGDYLHAHPTTALLVVEVAQTSLEYDREVKAPLYARAGIPEYWIVNLDGQCIEVYRDPAPIGEGFGYRSRRIYLKGESLAPLQKPEGAVKVDELLLA
jgi:Uma2 family endonuclease